MVVRSERGRDVRGHLRPRSAGFVLEGPSRRMGRGSCHLLRLPETGPSAANLDGWARPRERLATSGGGPGGLEGRDRFRRVSDWASLGQRVGGAPTFSGGR